MEGTVALRTKTKLTFETIAQNVINHPPYLFIVFLLLGAMVYGVTLPKLYSGDDLQYAMVIDTQVDGTQFFHPEGNPPLNADQMQFNLRYPLEYPTSALFYSIWKFFGWKDGSIYAIQWLRVIFGSVGLFFFFQAVRRMTQSLFSSFVVTAGFGTSMAYWTYSSHVDQSIVSLAFICLGFYIFVDIVMGTKRQPKQYFILLLALSAAILYNLTASFTYVLFSAAAIFLISTETIRKKVVVFLTVNVQLGLMIVVVIAALFAVSNDLSSLLTPAFWENAMFQGHPEYQVDPLRDAQRGVLGFAKSQVVYPPGKYGLQKFWDSSNSIEKLAMLSYYGFIMLALLLPVIFLFWNYRRLTRLMQLLIGAIGAWILLYSVFNFYWDPGFIKYWLVPLAGWWALTGVSLGLMRRSEAPFIWRFIFQRLMVLFVTFSFLTNFFYVILPDNRASNHPGWTLAQHLSEQSDSNALIISAGTDIDFYISYFSKRHLLSTYLILYGNGNDVNKLSKVITHHVTEYQAAGSDLYFLGNHDTDFTTLMEMIPSLEGYLLKHRWDFEGLTLYQLAF